MKLNTVKVSCYALLAVLCVFGLLFVATQVPAFGFIVFGALILLSVLALAFWRCPHCGKGLGSLNTKHCPSCGKKIDFIKY